MLVKRFYPDVELNLERGTPGASGFDVRAYFPPLTRNAELDIPSGGRAVINTGLSFAVPVGFEIQARPRSGLAAKYGITVLNSPGTIDSDYRGEVKIILINHGPEAYRVTHGDRIAQLVVCPVALGNFQLVTELPETLRGGAGFGSTGINEYSPTHQAPQ